MRRLSRSALVAAARRQPWSPLLALIALQLVGVLLFALSVPRNGWLFNHGGDQLWYATTGWLLAQGEMPIPHVSFGWPLALAPFTLVSGREFVGLLPPLVLLNVLVFNPLATVGMYGIGARIGGRALGYWTATLWASAPFALVLLTFSKYHEVIVEQFLPQALGLTSLADFPSMVLLIGAAFFALVALQDRDVNTAVLAGLLAGAAVSIKPSNALFVAGIALACAVAARFREAAAFALGLAPSLLVLLVWKVKGLGELPVAAGESARLAAGLSAVSLDSYGDFDWTTLRRNIGDVEEVIRGGLILLLAPLVGAVALARRSYPAALLCAGWLAAFVLIKGPSQFASTEGGTFFRLLTPAFPAYILLSALVPLVLFEAAGVARRGSEVTQRFRIGRRALVAGVVVTGVLPLLAVVAADPLDGPERAVRNGNTLVPVDGRIGLKTQREGAGVTLRWTDPSDRSSSIFYIVYRGEPGSATRCSDDGGAEVCELSMTPLASTRDQSWQDESPPDEAEYRIAVAANSVDDPLQGDAFLFSEPSVSSRSG
ncbi:MAG: hypothetical protein M3R12_09250 [Actinomycetota bacterium]|nr:hypothetical protein [Actinomycetota bacterium]